MGLVVHERVGLEGRRISPFSWRLRYALAHKGLEPEFIPTRFADVDRIRGLGGPPTASVPPFFTPSRTADITRMQSLDGRHFVPVLVDDGQVVRDTWHIAQYLEERFPDRPSLFGGATGQALTRLTNHWCDTVLAPVMRRLIAADFIWVIDPGDRAYYRSSREAQFGCTLEEYCQDRPHWLVVLAETCAPLEKTLSEQPWLNGSSPGYADYIVFSVFQWARVGCPDDVMPPSRSLADWRERLVNIYNGLGNRFALYPLQKSGPDGR